MHKKTALHVRAVGLFFFCVYNMCTCGADFFPCGLPCCMYTCCIHVQSCRFVCIEHVYMCIEYVYMCTEHVYMCIEYVYMQQDSLQGGENA